MLSLEDGDSHSTVIIVISFRAFLSISVPVQEPGKQFSYSCGFNKNKMLSNGSQVDFNEEHAGPPVYLVARLASQADKEVLAAALLLGAAPLAFPL